MASECHNLSEEPRCRFWGEKLRRFVAGLRQRRLSRWVMCLQVHRITGLPPAMDGQALSVGWRARGWTDELTAPVHIRRGIARFDEVFLRSGRRSSTQNFTIWVSLVDSGTCNLGTFELDSGGVVLSGEDDRSSSGKTLVLGLSGMAEGGVLTVSVYHRVTEAGGGKQGNCSCLPCLSHSRKYRAPADTGEFAANDIYLAENESFTSTEETAPKARPPSSASFDTSECNEESSSSTDLSMEEEMVEAEFLRMIEGHGSGIGWEDEETLSLILGFDAESEMETDSLIIAAAVETESASRARRRPVGSALEEEEFKQLVKMWKAGRRSVCHYAPLYSLALLY